MDTSSSIPDARAIRVAVTANTLTVELADGRSLSVPLQWFPRLLKATAEQRTHWRLVGDGEGIRWPDLDEDLRVEELLRGSAAPGTTRRAV